MISQFNKSQKNRIEDRSHVEKDRAEDKRQEEEKRKQERKWKEEDRVTEKAWKEEDREIQLRKEKFQLESEYLMQCVEVLHKLISFYKNSLSNAIFEASQGGYVETPTIQNCLEADPYITINYDDEICYTGVTYNELRKLKEYIENKYSSNYLLLELKSQIQSKMDDSYNIYENGYVYIHGYSFEGNEIREIYKPVEVSADQDPNPIIDLDKKLLCFAVEKLKEIEKVLQENSTITINLVY